ncbi:MAG: hypothetical protein QM706_06800 [Nitrospira sp.]
MARCSGLRLPDEQERDRVVGGGGRELRAGRLISGFFAHTLSTPTDKRPAIRFS